MIEKKSVMIYPHEKEKAIDHYKLYGWRLVGTEEVIRDNYTIEDAGDHDYLNNSSYKMLKLNFERGQNDKRILKDETEFRSHKYPIKHVKIRPLPGFFFWVITIILYYLAIKYLISNINDDPADLIVLDYIIPVIMLGYPILHIIVRYFRDYLPDKKMRDERKARDEETQRLRDEVEKEYEDELKSFDEKNN